ncbi:unnamed protein product [Musa textilis]
MAEMGCDPELRLSLGSGVEQQRRQTQQKKMTIFYQGRVCVCDATEMQARAIISMAKREMEDTVTTKQQRQSKEEESSSRAVALQVLDPGLSMKRSLQRFLQKRKARVSDATPLGQRQKLLQFPIKLQRA